MILDAHDSALHRSVDSTLKRVRSHFRVIRGRQTVKKVIKPCVLCKWFQGHTLKPRPIADLPSYRVCSEHALDTTGIGYAGPLLVKDVFTKERVQESIYHIYHCLHVLRQDVHIHN